MRSNDFLQTFILRKKCMCIHANIHIYQHALLKKCLNGKDSNCVHFVGNRRKCDRADVVYLLYLYFTNFLTSTFYYSKLFYINLQAKIV